MEGRFFERRRALARWLWALALALALPAIFKVSIGDVYRVRSHSMEPVLRGATAPALGGPEGGERVLVLYGVPRALRRFDLVVAEQEGEEHPAVKRVAGLPGESVRIADGDLLVDGRHLDAREPRPRPVALFDARRHPAAGQFQVAGEVELGAEVWKMRAGTTAARASWTGRLDDGYLSANSTRVAGHHEVGDGVVQGELRLPDRAASMFLEWTERGDRFRGWLDFEPPSLARARLVRSSDAAGAEWQELVAAEWALGLETWVEFEFGNVDNVLVLRLGRSEPLRASFAANTPVQGAPDPAYRHLAPRLTLGVERGSGELRNVVVGRDLHYTARGRFAVESALVLGPDEVFLLGDNSGESADGRDWGPTPLRALIGTPRTVLWPRWRALEGRSPAHSAADRP
jgi:type IV secretory pathway protease TraF